MQFVSYTRRVPMEVRIFSWVILFAATMAQSQLKFPGCTDLKDAEFRKVTLETGGFKEPTLLAVAGDGRVFVGTRSEPVNPICTKLCFDLVWIRWVSYPVRPPFSVC